MIDASVGGLVALFLHPLVVLSILGPDPSGAAVAKRIIVEKIFKTPLKQFKRSDLSENHERDDAALLVTLLA